MQKSFSTLYIRPANHISITKRACHICIYISVYGYTYMQDDGNFRETLTHMGTCYSGLVRAHVSWREEVEKTSRDK